MTRIIAVSNQKGGVRKSTSTQAIASILTRRGHKVLAIDIDAQGNLSDSVNAVTEDTNTIYEVLKQEASPDEAIQHFADFDIIPADIVLASAEQTLAQTGKEYRLKEALEKITNPYDFILIDTPPSLGLLTVNAFTAADEVLIPTTAGKFAAKGIKELFNTVKSVKKYFNHDLFIKGILFTQFDPRTNNSKDIRALVEKMGEALDIPVFQTFIRSRVAVEEAQARGQSLLNYTGCEDVIEDYENFLNEYLKEPQQWKRLNISPKKS
jgi:chromosome partitioning protein